MNADLPNLTFQFEETLDAPQGPVVDSDLPSHGPMALVEGSRPRLTEETQSLLRNRLRISALVLSFGFLVFLVRQLFAVPRFSTPTEWALFGFHVAVTALTGTVGALMCRGCRISPSRLRIAELLVFGGPALFFLVMQFINCQHCVQNGVIPSMVPPWLMLIFTYALFVPNSWPRAAAVVGAMAVAPVVVSVYHWATMPEFAALLEANSHAYAGYHLEIALTMVLAFLIAIVGVHTIGSLRREAFEAKQLGRYRLKHRLGEGGMGEVYLAEHQLMKRPCAIKVIRPEKAGDPQVLARFEREVRSTAKLSHWNTVEVFDYGRSEEGTFYYVMEYLPGLNLTQLVLHHDVLPPERMIHLITQTCDALNEAHAHGFIHRDIKPGNIFAAYRGGQYDVAKLLDFGLAKPLTGELSQIDLTQDGAITGSPLFMSPEQATGDDLADARSDIYSLGGVCYYLLTGQPPFEGDRPMKVVIAHAHEEVLPPSQIRPEIPADLELVVLRCLAKDPDDRYQDAMSLRQALADCQSAGLWNQQRAAQWWKKHGCPDKRAFDDAALEAAVV